MKNILLISLLLCGCSQQKDTTVVSTQPFSTEKRDSLSQEMYSMLQKHILDPWYPASVDEQFGGYITHFDYQWKPEKNQPKMAVTQSRLIWTASVASSFFLMMNGY